MSAYTWALASLLNALLRTFTAVAAPTSPIAVLLAAYGPGVRTVAMFVFTPLVTSLILLGLIEALRRLGLSSSLQIVAASVALCLAACISSVAWAIVVAPVFVLCAFSYVYWRSISLRTAFTVSFLIQAFHNVIPAIRAIYDNTRNA